MPGRFRRQRLPLPRFLPDDEGTERCFLCHPERDPFDRGGFPDDQSPIRVLGNAYSFADRTLILAPWGESFHSRTPADLPVEVLKEWIRATISAELESRFDLKGFQPLIFLNVGRLAAQSRLHPHLQVVAFRQWNPKLVPWDRDSVEKDLVHADQEGRVLRPATRDVRWRAVVPARPSATAEIWIEGLKSDPDGDALLLVAHALRALCSACERGIGGSYNVVWVKEPPLLRLIPRGLSERAGLELISPAQLGSMVAASAEETLDLWRTALAAGPNPDP